MSTMTTYFTPASPPEFADSLLLTSTPSTMSASSSMGGDDDEALALDDFDDPCLVTCAPGRQLLASSPVQLDLAGGDPATVTSAVYCFIKNFVCASGSSTVAIDNKIEQAMDLVKSHLMFAVREEVEVLKERIDDLLARISVLETENQLLRAAASQETLAQLAQLESTYPPAGSAENNNGAPNGSANPPAGQGNSSAGPQMQNGAPSAP